MLYSGMAKISVLELGRVREGGDSGQALKEAGVLAKHLEELEVFERIWVAEHHNMPAVTTAATSVVVGYLAAQTKKIRVGAGGIMLPNHAPYIIAEQFGTLHALFGDRIDLALGRAPGTDPMTLRALRRNETASDHFPQDVLELQAYLQPATPFQKIQAIPGEGSNVPLWILGSSHFGAALAAELGLPYGFASHFAPQMLESALQIYRTKFKPSSQLSKPYVLIGVNVVIGESDAEAAWLATSQEQSFLSMIRGKRTVLGPAVEDMDALWMPHEKAHVMKMLSCRAVGSRETVAKELKKLQQNTQADELMVVTDLFDFGKRLESFDRLAGIIETWS